MRTSVRRLLRPPRQHPKKTMPVLGAIYQSSIYEQSKCMSSSAGKYQPAAMPCPALPCDSLNCNSKHKPLYDIILQPRYESYPVLLQSTPFTVDFCLSSPTRVKGLRRNEKRYIPGVWDLKFLHIVSAHSTKTKKTGPLSWT